MAYSEILDDERKETAAGFWTRANAFFASIGVTVTAVMTDNGACYRSHAFADALGDTVKHKWTKPYRPQTNGKVERFNRTLSAFGSSFGFMLPISTPQNALVYATGAVPITRMVRSGVVFDVLAAVLVTASVLLTGRLFGIV